MPRETKVICDEVMKGLLIHEKFEDEHGNYDNYLCGGCGVYSVAVFDSQPQYDDDHAGHSSGKHADLAGGQDGDH